MQLCQQDISLYVLSFIAVHQGSVLEYKMCQCCAGWASLRMHAKKLAVVKNWMLQWSCKLLNIWNISPDTIQSSQGNGAFQTAHVVPDDSILVGCPGVPSPSSLYSYATIHISPKLWRLLIKIASKYWHHRYQRYWCAAQLLQALPTLHQQMALLSLRCSNGVLLKPHRQPGQQSCRKPLAKIQSLSEPCMACINLSTACILVWDGGVPSEPARPSFKCVIPTSYDLRLVLHEPGWQIVWPRWNISSLCAVWMGCSLQSVTAMLSIMM